MPFFSVIIPTYNRAALLREALDSVFAQSFHDYEVVVVDDGSTDHTAQVIADCGKQVEFLRQPKRGPGAARNLGASRAKGTFLAFLDSDDLWFPWTLETYSNVLRNSPDVHVVLGQTLRFSVATELAAYIRTSLHARTYPDFLTAAQKPTFFGTGYAVIRRDLFQNLGGIREGILVYEDQDLGLRLGTSSRCAVVRSPVTVAYRRTPDSLTTSSRQGLGGIGHLIQNEKAGRYPGGAQRRRERQNYIAFTVRSLSCGFLKQKRLRDAWWLYYRTFFWHVRLKRVRFLFGFPLLLLKGVFTYLALL